VCPRRSFPAGSTQRGHGAEITLTAEPCLGDDLLPTTFRSLAINDLVDMIAPPLTACVNDPGCRAWAATISGGMATDAEPAARQGVMAAMESLAAAPTLTPRRGCRENPTARMPLPFSQLADVSGVRQIAILIRDAHAAARPPSSQSPVHRICRHPRLSGRGTGSGGLTSWPVIGSSRSGRNAGLQLADLVRGRRHRRPGEDPLPCVQPDLRGNETVGQQRTSLAGGVRCDDRLAATPICRTTTAVLAWGILVRISRS